MKINVLPPPPPPPHKLLIIVNIFAFLLSSCSDGDNDTLLSPLPNDFTAIASDSQVTLSWTQHPDATYSLYHSSDFSCDMSNYSLCSDGAMFTSKSSGFVDAGLTNGTTYYYWIESILDGITFFDEQAISATPRADSNIDLSNGLIAHYEFEGNVNDSSGNGNDGEVFGDISYIDGVIGQAIHFDNSNVYIAIKSNFTLDDFSIAFYGKIDAQSSAKINLLQANQSHSDNIFGLAYDSDFAYLLHNSQTTNSQHYYDLLVTEWANFVLQPNGVGGFDIYLDGNKAITFYLALEEMPFEYIVLAQGCFGECFTSEQNLTGSLDDLRIYNRTLNAAEIQALRIAEL